MGATEFNDNPYEYGKEFRLMSACALRFLGYEYEAARVGRDAATGAWLVGLAQTVRETGQLHADELHNFGAFFSLQRGIGREYDVGTSGWAAFAKLFLLLHQREVPPQYRHAEYDAQWKQDGLLKVPHLKQYAEHLIFQHQNNLRDRLFNYDRLTS